MYGLSSWCIVRFCRYSGGSHDRKKNLNRPNDRRKQAVLSDPLFLQHHVWMGLEKERLELLTAHVKAQSHRCGTARGLRNNNN